MPTFILAGYQRSLAPRVKNALAAGADRFNGWTSIAFTGHKNNAPDIGKAQVDELCRLAEEHDGSHIFGVSAEKTRNQIEDLISPHFRFRWIDAKTIGRVGTGDEAPLVAALSAATQEENYWLTNVKPKDSASPLVLPEIFCAKRDFSGLWRLANSYNNEGHLQAAATLIERFTRYHRRHADGFSKTPWQDDDSWIWNDDGERHGDPEFPNEDWKYSFRLPDGFHFDVSPSAKGKFFFTDIHKNRHKFKKHLNITAHGEVRGVK